MFYERLAIHKGHTKLDFQFKKFYSSTSKVESSSVLGSVGRKGVCSMELLCGEVLAGAKGRKKTARDRKTERKVRFTPAQYSMYYEKVLSLFCVVCTSMFCIMLRITRFYNIFVSHFCCVNIKIIIAVMGRVLPEKLTINH